MTTTKHTPGPWKIDDSGSMIETEHPVNLRGEYEHICDFRPDLAGNINEANARLIAASPTLYDALEMAQATIERLQRHAPGSADGTLDVIRKALTKATAG